MDAMILGAGLGTRLQALGRSLPKVLVPVGDRPLLGRQLDYLEGAGFTRVVVNAFHLGEQVERFVAGYDGPLAVECILEPRLLGTAGAVRNALDRLTPGPCFVLYGDVLVAEPIAAMLALHRGMAADATLAAYAADSTEGKGVVEADAAGRITAFREKAGRGPGLVNAGLYVVETALMEALVEPGGPADFGHDVFPEALAREARLLVHRLSEPVIDIGTPEGLAAARAAVTADA
jgi:NDP-sugar pyrophosphorylase family protein